MTPLTGMLAIYTLYICVCVCALISLVYIFGVNSKQNFCISLQPSTVNTAESCAVASLRCFNMQMRMWLGKGGGGGFARPRRIKCSKSSDDNKSNI